MDKKFFEYIMASRKNGVLYIGMTSNIIKRVHEHKNSIFKGFTTKYRVSKLVYFEFFSSPYDAIIREKRLKKWNRSWKGRLIEKENPNWEDLYYKIIE
jgi:putative endonuclease